MNIKAYQTLTFEIDDIEIPMAQIKRKGIPGGTGHLTVPYGCPLVVQLKSNTIIRGDLKTVPTDNEGLNMLVLYNSKTGEKTAEINICDIDNIFTEMEYKEILDSNLSKEEKASKYKNEMTVLTDDAL